MTAVLTPSDADRLRKQKAEAEEQRCRRVLEGAGWTVTTVTDTKHGPHYAIVNTGETHKYGTPEELAQQVRAGKKHRQHKEQVMADINSDKREGPGFGAKTGSYKGGGDSRSPLEKRGGGPDFQTKGGSNTDTSVNDDDKE
ncbi:MAG: hypothetical protein M3O92_00675 [Actinomycetota bacterium]|nr:hypothetical protein [Actinomycetota bacterium]